MSRKLADFSHDPTGRGCALAGRVNDEEDEYTIDVCVLCLTEEARHDAGMHLDEYGAWFSHQPTWIPLLDNGDCARCEGAWYASQQGE
jgi:hypothetical protein